MGRRRNSGRKGFREKAQYCSPIKYLPDKETAEQQARFLTLGRLRSSEGEFFDEVLAVRFDKGASYTAEESVEIHCHGGLLPAQKCMEELCSMGARLAQPGEFTRRAFVNGRIDLPQAEACSV